MRFTRLSFLYVALYTALLGISLLFLPHRLPGIVFDETEEVWVRVLGMVLIGMSIFHVEVFRSGRPFIFRPGLINQGALSIILSYLVFTSSNTLLRLVFAVVLAGFVASLISYIIEIGSDEETRYLRLPKTACWNVYVAGYTCAYGMCGAVFPLLVFPLLDFPETDGLWVRMSGVSFLVLCLYNIAVFRARGSDRYIFAIWLLRSWVLVVLLVMGFMGYPWGLLFSAGIVGIGVVGTALFYFPERQSLQSGERN